MTTAIDPNSLSTEELRNLIVSGELPEIEPEPEQPRDEFGRFTTAEEPTAEPEDAEAEVEVPEMFVREIDLGDGSGVQVFKAESLEELVDKLAEAQANATKKIRELSQPRPVKVEELNPDQEVALSQALLAEPSKVLRRQIEQTFGMPVDEIRDNLRMAKETRVAQEADQAAREFVAETPDYFACPENFQRISRYMDRMGMPPTKASIQQAYSDLNADGILRAKPTNAQTPAPRSSGISTRRSSAPPVKTAEDFRREASKLSAAELLERAGGYQYRP